MVGCLPWPDWSLPRLCLWQSRCAASVSAAAAANSQQQQTAATSMSASIYTLSGPAEPATQCTHAVHITQRPHTKYKICSKLTRSENARSKLFGRTQQDILNTALESRNL